MGASASTQSALLLCMILLYTIQLPVSIVAAYVLPAILLFHPRERTAVDLSSFRLFVFTLTPLIPALLFFNHGLAPIVYAALTPSLFILARSLASRSLEHGVKVFRTTYWVFTCVISVAVAARWGEAEPLGAILPWVSTNGIPAYLIVVQCVYSLVFFLHNGRLPLLCCVATVGVSVIGLGRGSILVACALLLFSLVTNMLLNARTTGFTLKIRVGSAVMLALVLVVTYWSQVSDALVTWYAGSRLSIGLYDEYRAEMIKGYVEKLDGIKLLFGAGYEGTSITLYDRNPHNSFLRAHAFYGLYCFFLILFPVVAVFQSKRIRRQKVVAIALVTLILVRATSEPILFPTPLDFFYIALFFYYFRFSTRRDNNELG
jgi:hypothetical protein